MSPTLRNLLVAAGVLGVSTIYVLAPGADDNAVKTAALADGFVARAAEAEFSITPAGRAWLLDAGLDAPPYARLQFPIGLGVGKEPDGGNSVILPDLPFTKLRVVRLQDVDVATCASRPNICPLWGTDRPFRVVQHLCAWKPNAGAACGRINPDGGAALDPGVANTMQPASWVGAGCVRKACVEIAGESSAP
jgi:hypothetical protein